MNNADSRPAVVGQVERVVRPAVAEALRLAEKMMRDSWSTGDDAAWQPSRLALEAHLNTAFAAENALWMARVEQAFREGYWARETYNDGEVSDADEKWESAKAGLLSA